MIRVLLAVLLGLGAGAALLDRLVDADWATWVWAPSFVGATLLALVLVVAKAARASGRVPPGVLEAAVASGRVHPARIEKLTRTGLTVNDVAQYAVTMTVDSHDRPPYRTTVKLLIDPSTMPARQPGGTVSVARLYADAPDVAILERAAGDVREWAVASAQDWPVDPHARVEGRPSPLVGTGPRGRGRRLLAYAVAFAVPFALLLAPAREEVELRVRTVVSGTDLVSYTAGPDRAAAAIEGVAGLVEGERVARVLLYDSWIRVQAPSRPDATTFDDFHYRGGSLTDGTPAPIQPATEALFDLADVDWSVVPDLYDEAVDASGLGEDELDDHVQLVSVERGPGADGPGEVTISVRLNGDYGSYVLVADASGRVLERDD